MTAQLLAGELTTLVQDTKRKAPEIKSAAEKSLADLRSLSNTSESQLAADLRRRPDFIQPFLLACKAGNPKYATPAVVSLQRLVAANGLAQERLEDLLESLRECSSLGTDVQLRVLQIMPSLFQRYDDQISEARLATALQVCFVLQAAKSAMISHTAAATLQQIVNDVFTRVGTEKALAEAASPETSRSSWQAELDCHQVLLDLCLIAEGKPVESLRKANVSKDFALELIGTVLLNHTEVIPKYTNFVDVLRQQLLPLMLRVVSSAAPFPQTVRALRLVSPVVEGFLEILPTELEMLLSMLAHMLEPDAAASWKRTLCMEALRNVYKDPSNTRRMYAIFDQREGHKPLIQEQLAIFGRLAAEKPAIIGLGQSSSVPATTEQTDDDFDGLAALQADPLMATTGVSFSNKTATISGISVHQSSIKVSLIDQLDKAEAPSIPPSYIYALVLSSLNLLCDGLARYVLPFASSKAATSSKQDQASEGHSDESSDEQSESQLPTNPLTLKGHAEEQQIRAAASLVEKCWPALLSAYSTFFQAALDAEYYHSTIRSFQKLIQVATLLRSATARDAFLTALAKQSLPIEESRQATSEALSDDRRGAVSSVPRVSSRNLLCLRALLNLGIALGAVLDDAWPIVLNTLQEADVIIGYISTDRTLSRGGPASIAPSVGSSGELSKELSSEISAVRSAASRMFGSASDLPKEQYIRFLDFVNGLARGNPDHALNTSKSTQPSGHRRSSSGTLRSDGHQDLRGNVFVIDVYSQLIDLSKTRLASDLPDESGWSCIVGSLLQLVKRLDLDFEIRFAAADTICKSIIAATFTDSDETPDSLVPYGLAALVQLTKIASSQGLAPEDTSRAGDSEIHNSALTTLKSCLDQYGESIFGGWGDVCTIILSAFQSDGDLSSSNAPSCVVLRPYSQRSLRSAFGSLQVVCSDLIDHLPSECLLRVLHAVYSCCAQELDLNLALTSTSLYQSLSDSIWAGQKTLDLDNSSEQQSTKAKRWLQLLYAIIRGTTSLQSETRNSAVHACFRIFDSVGGKLRPEDWSVCIKDAIMALYEQNGLTIASIVDPRAADGPSIGPTETSSAKLALLDTAATIHTNTCALFEDHLSAILASASHDRVWASWIDHLDAFISSESLTLTTAIFAGLSRVLGTLDNEDSRFAKCIPPTWALLAKHQVHSHTRLDRPGSSDNQPALIAFISCATELYRVSAPHDRTKAAPRLLSQVVEAVSESSTTSYVADLINVTPLQTDSLKLLDFMYKSTDQSIIPELLEAFAKLLTLSHEKDRDNETVKGPTFVALTSSVADHLERVVAERSLPGNLHKDHGMLSCLQALHLLVGQKRGWRKDEKLIQVWQKAITTGVAILSPLLTLALRDATSHTSSIMWTTALKILDAILGVGQADEDSELASATNVEFDIDAFSKCYNLLVPALGSQSVQQLSKHCSRFAEILFSRSIIHEPHPDDSLDPTETSIWRDRKRIGRVRDLEPNDRSKLCYLLADRLFELVTAAGKLEEHTSLANAAAPFLRLRLELILKAYITDQPLRGRMPCPLIQKKELIYMLHQSVAMDQSEDVTPEARKLSEEHRKSLIGLAIMALRITKQDEKIKEALLGLLEVAEPQFRL